MTRDEKNRIAYDDCSLFNDPSMPWDEEFMELYRFWRDIARFPGDEQ